MDMHRLKFPDATFDLAFGSHVFEHAWDLGRVADEVVRVLRPKAHVFCAVPRASEPNWHDRYCFDKPEEVIAYFAQAEPEVLYQEVRPQEIRLLFRVSRA
jgi:ubiquinone/menaquinone biosynthesis C-methylase UbiE